MFLKISKVILAWMIFLLLALMALYLSTQPSVESKSLSEALARKVYPYWIFGTRNPVTFHRYLRKAGHFGAHLLVGCSEYLAIWWTIRCRRLKRALAFGWSLTDCYVVETLWRGRKLAIVLTILLASALAVLGEVLQGQVAGRSPTVLDAMINIFGIISGTLAGVLVF